MKMKNLVGGVFVLAASVAQAGGLICTDSRGENSERQSRLALTVYVPFTPQVNAETPLAPKAIVAVSQGSLNNILSFWEIEVKKSEFSETTWIFENAEKGFSLKVVFDDIESKPGSGTLSARIGGGTFENQILEGATVSKEDLICGVGAH